MENKLINTIYKDMKAKYNILCPVALVIIIFLTSSCIKEELVDPPRITLNMDWSNRTDGVEIPSDYKVMINNQTLTYQTAVNTLSGLNAGTYSVFIFNPADKIKVDNWKATIVTTNGIVDNQPGWIFSHTSDIMFENDKEKDITIVMQQQIHLLNITLSITEGDPNDIVSITASLSGIANAMDMKTDTYSGTGLSVIPVFTRNNDKLTSSVRLIGLTSEAQKLTLNITYKNETRQQIVSNISNQLINFNRGKHQPVILQGNLKILSGVDYQTTITGWDSQDTIAGDAEEQE